MMDRVQEIMRKVAIVYRPRGFRGLFRAILIVFLKKTGVLSPVVRKISTKQPFPRPPGLKATKHYVVFTFDTEEDWHPNFGYFNSYKYITSGIFYQLVDGLTERNVSATFNITPNLAKDMPKLLKYLENKKQTIGVHPHPHTLIKIDYPFKTKGRKTNEYKITCYDFAEKLKLMRLAKDTIESVVGHEVLLYRSGGLLCDYEVEKIGSLLGYRRISNYRNKTYFIRPLNIWNLGPGTGDISTPRNLTHWISKSTSFCVKSGISVCRHLSGSSYEAL